MHNGFICMGINLVHTMAVKCAELECTWESGYPGGNLSDRTLTFARINSYIFLSCNVLLNHLRT